VGKTGRTVQVEPVQGDIPRRSDVRRQSLLFWLTSFCLVAVPGTPLARGEEPPAAVLSADQLKAKILECQSKIHSFYIAYQSERGAYPEPRFPPGTYLRCVLAAKSPDRMYYVTAHGRDGVDWTEDPEHRFWYFTGEVWVGDSPVNRTYTTGKLSPRDELPGGLAEDFFFYAVGLWLFDQHQAPRLEGRPIVLREVAASPKYSTVRPQQELVDGRWCHVLENEGVERLWIDTEHGCALLARETFYGTPPVLTQRLESMGHREVAPGVWLPSRMRNIQYNWRARTEAARKVKMVDAVHLVLEARANDVDDALFEFRPKPGALDASRATAPVQTQSGGLDHIDNVAAWIQRHRLVPTPALEYGGYLAGLPALGLIAAFEVWLYWRRNRDSFSGAKRGKLEKSAVS
jgi:hypothetical protein